MTRWNDKSQREMSERQRKIARGQKSKVAAAMVSTDGHVVKFMDPLADQEMRDYRTAKAIDEAREAEK